MSTSHIFNVEQLHLPPPSHPEVIHLPGDDYLPGPALFPGELIAGYHAHFSQYTAESWAEYVLGETRKLPKGRVAFACSGANSGNTGGRYWFGSSYSELAEPSSFVKAPRSSEVAEARAYNIPVGKPLPSVPAASNPPKQILRTYKGQHELPTLEQVNKGATATSLPFGNIQADILVGMKKQIELFYFFSIEHPTAFKAHLRSNIIHLVTPTTAVLPGAKQPAAMLNIAFSQSGLSALHVHDDLGDDFFAKGQFADAEALNDVVDKWEAEFKGTAIHGVFLIASDLQSCIDDMVMTLKRNFGTSIKVATTVHGASRPGDQAGHEHFGFLDGISNPTVKELMVSHPGQGIVPDGVILAGRQGDPTLAKRPSWALDGSFLVFRKLQQAVPEFNKYLHDNPLQNAEGTLSVEEGAELLGARMVGRWKSGAPIDLTPLVDNPSLGANPNANNNFDFRHFNDLISSDQNYCPFSAHIRKTRPRVDIASPGTGGQLVQDTLHQAIRAGIPFGPELTDDEKAAQKTSELRGLAFVEYQSVIANGFRTQQIIWMNNDIFPPGKDETVGIDPIMGQSPNGANRLTNGLDPANPKRQLSVLAFITPLGGEYFFSPSISALKHIADA